jgi:phytoene synthase
MAINTRTYTYDEAMRAVKARVAASKTSFTAGMMILPKARREGMYALYAFCRVVDDIADDSPSADIARAGLAQWRGFIAEAFQGRASDEITTALLPAISAFGLVETDFQAIIDGMEMDMTAIVAPDFATFDLYCDRVASAVGRISVRIFGDSSDRAMKVSYHLGRALQQTNILRDLAEDAARGRLYLPREILNHFDIQSRDPAAVLNDPRLPDACRLLAKTTREHYKQAEAAMRQCRPQAMRSAKIMRAYYGAIFDRLEAKGFTEPRRRVTLGKAEKLFLMLKGFVA